MADTLTSRKLLGQLLVGVMIVVGLAVVGTLLSLFALNLGDRARRCTPR